MLVGVLEGQGGLAGDPEGILDRQLRLADEPAAQGLAPPRSQATQRGEPL